MPPVVGRIRRSDTFRALARPQGRGASGPVTVVFSRRTSEPAAFPLVGYAVGRRHGGAVARNRLRRRLRAAVRDTAAALPPGAYLVRATTSATSLGADELRRAVAVAARTAAGARRDRAAHGW